MSDTKNWDRCDVHGIPVHPDDGCAMCRIERHRVDERRRRRLAFGTLYAFIHGLNAPKGRSS